MPPPPPILPLPRHRRHWCGLALACWLASLLGAWAQDTGPWQHAASPYRAVFTIKTQPSVPAAGYFVTVPLSGIGDEDGRNVHIFSDDNRLQTSHAMGRTRDNSALLVAGDKPLKGRLYAYFGSEQRPTSAKALFTPGLTVDLRTLEGPADTASWKAVQAALTRSKRLGVLPLSKLELMHNPLGSQDAFLMDFTGGLLLAQPAEWELFMVVDDAGWFLLNDLVVIDRSGRHGAGAAVQGAGRQKLALKQGANPFRAVVVDLGGPQAAVLARYENERQKYTVPPEAFVSSGETVLEKVEARHPREVPCPAFGVKLLSYIGADTAMLTEVEFTSLSGDSLEWRLSNGLAGEGVTWRVIVAGNDPLKVQTKAGKRYAGNGELLLLSVPPAKPWHPGPDYERYTRIMLASNLAELTPGTLRAYYTFLNYEERNPDLAPVCLALLGKGPDAPLSAERQAWLSALATSSARQQAEQARAAYQRLFAQLTPKEAPALALQFLEFELYRGNDWPGVTKTFELLKKRGWGPTPPPLLTLLTGELALYQGDLPAAKKAFDELRASVAQSPNFRAFAVIGNATLEQYKLNLSGGFLDLAEDNLRTWILAAPESLNDGHYALMRARFLRRLGWHDGVLRVLAGFQAMNALPAFLPDLELERALALLALKRDEEGRALLADILKQFPNHPAATAAKARLGQK